MSPAALRRLDEVVDERVDPLPRRSGRTASISSRGRPASARIPKRIASSMSWLMYATRSTMRTILPSSVAGSRSPVCVRIPSWTLCARSSCPAIRKDCSLWRNRPAEALSQHLVERVLARVAERGVAHVVTEADRLDEVPFSRSARATTREIAGRLQRVRHTGAVVVADRVDEHLGLALQAPELLRVDDPVAVALERGAHGAVVLGTPRGRASRTSARRAVRASAPPARGLARRTRRQLSRRSRASLPSVLRGSAARSTRPERPGAGGGEASAFQVALDVIGKS